MEQRENAFYDVMCHKRWWFTGIHKNISVGVVKLDVSQSVSQFPPSDYDGQTATPHSNNNGAHKVLV